MASAPTLKTTATESNLTSSLTLKGHGDLIQAISYYPDGQRIISGSWDKTTRQWDLKVGKEIEEARVVCKGQVWAVAVSRNGRWVVTASGGDGDRAELKACDVETGIVRTFEGHSRRITCIDISADNRLLASGSDDFTTRIWSFETGELVAGPFRGPGAVRFSTDSKKLAVRSWLGMCLEVRDVQSQKLDVRIGEFGGVGFTHKPAVCWTKRNKTIISPFNFTANDNAKTIYEFDASTLETVGAPFEGHIKDVTGLALSFDHALLASASFDNTIKLWDCESRQLLASFNAQSPGILILSPDSHQFAYATYIESDDDFNICICDTPPDVLVRTSARKKPAHHDLSKPDAIRCSTVRRKPPIPATPMAPRPLPTVEPQQPVFLRLKNLLGFSPRAKPVRPSENSDTRDPLDFSATLPLPHPILGTQRNTAAGALKKAKDMVPDEYLDPASHSAAAVQLATGEHGSGRSCLCF